MTFQRLDSHLSHLADISRSQAQKWIQAGLVQLNGETILKAGFSVKEQDLVTWQLPLPEAAKNIQNLEPIRVLYEDDNVLVIEKEAFCKVHPSVQAPNEITLIDRLEAYLGKKWLQGMGDSIRPGIIHRLDKDTSGLLLVAKNSKAHAHYASFFEKREVLKEYYTLVKGHLRHPKARIEAAMRRDRKDPLKMSLHPQGKEAITEYELLEEFKESSLLKVCIKTGRMHQIRVHMASIGHPVIGDSVYGDKSLNKKFLEQYELKRQFLHAFHLKIDQLDISIDLPQDLQFVIQALKKTS